MAGLNETPGGNRIRIAFFGRRNAGKSTLVNAFTGQDIAIVSDVPGTTTDPVSKAMEILPLGPCLITDTAGLDDEGALGAQRVRKSLDVLATTDVAVWVEADAVATPPESFLAECRRLKTRVLVFRRGDSVEGLKRQIAALDLADDTPGLLDGLAAAGDSVVAVCPIDASAPKGRLILPQVQVLRDCLDRHLVATVCQPAELASVLAQPHGGTRWVITDSQAFKAVDAMVRAANDPQTRLTSFSVLFARQKGDLEILASGLAALGGLRDGDRVLIAEGCTHHRQCNDIGAVKIPKALAKLTGRRLEVSFSSGTGFPDLAAMDAAERPALVVHCGGCMLTRREMHRRLQSARAAGVPVVNYGLLLAAAAGVDVKAVLP